MNEQDDLEKKYGGNQTNNSHQNDDFDDEGDDEIENFDNNKIYNKYEQTPHNKFNRNLKNYVVGKDYERKIKLLIILLVLSCLLFFIVGLSTGFVFSKNRRPRIDNPINETPHFGKGFYKDLPELIRFLKRNYYKDLNEEQIKSLIVETVTNQADRYTRLEPAGYYLGGNAKPGGFGIRIEPVVTKKYAGIKIFSITKFTKAYENLKTGVNAVYPGDIIVGYYRNDKIYEYFQDFLPRHLYSQVLYDNSVVSGAENFHAGILFNNSNDPVKVIIYNPLSSEKKVREVLMEYQKYYNQETFHQFKKSDFTGSSLDANYNMAYVRLNEFSKADTEQVLKQLNHLETVSPKIDELIFDLRNNPGGGSSELEQLLNFFIKRNETSPEPLYIMHQSSARLHINEDTKAKIVLQNSSETTYDIFTNKNANPIPPTYKVSILLNSNSASASEVFSSVMKEHYHDCQVIGNNTFGKDVYQSIFTYNEHKLESFKGYNIRVTNGKWGYFPKGSKSFFYITDYDKQIVNGPNATLLNYLPAFKHLPQVPLKLDMVASENAELSLILKKFLLNNIDSSEPKYNTLFSNLTANIPSFTKEDFKNNTSNFLRVDGYFDNIIGEILRETKRCLGDVSPNNAYDYEAFKLLFHQGLAEESFSILKKDGDKWYEVLDTYFNQDPYLYEAIYK